MFTRRKMNGAILHQEQSSKIWTKQDDEAKRMKALEQLLTAANDLIIQYGAQQRSRAGEAVDLLMTIQKWAVEEILTKTGIE